ncbi:hypothetical protein [Streptomyces inhibens]|uniref:hypothetical protein n=1 Tax=Streptomyces inhibens TaxID=2293571 RepID=UPI001FD2EEA2|nr:hypothetical protein [Streptomyces inhibens]
MRARGINDDTGFLPGEQLSRKTFTAEAVRQDMAVIAGELHCDAVRISGGDPERLSIAAACAAEAGLEWRPGTRRADPGWHPVISGTVAVPPTAVRY